MATPKIHRIQIRDFRRLRGQFEFDLTAPNDQPVEQALFAGPNGCGKTSVLEAILLALGCETLIVRDLDARAREEHWRTAVPEGAEIALDVSFDDQPKSTWVRTCSAHWVRNEDGTKSQLPPDILQRMEVEYFSSWRAPELVGPIIPLVGPGRRPNDTETNRLRRLKQRINDERAKGGYLSGMNRAEEWLAQLNGAWNRFHGADDTTIDAQIVDADAEQLQADLFVLNREGERICSIDQTSSGEIELLSFAGWVILNGFTGGLLIVDEPELHLHPQWEATMLPALRTLAPQAQFVVASHGDAVWDQTPGFARFLLVPESDPRSREWREKKAIDT